MQTEFVTAAVFVGVLITVVALRTATKSRIEITLNDAIIAALAAGLTLLTSGFITKLIVGTEGVTIETAAAAIRSAAARPIDKQVSPLPVAPFEEALKGGLGVLPLVVKRRVQGVDFELGGGGYQAEVVREYLETLSGYQFFRGFVLLRPDRALFGMIDGRRLLAYMQDQASGTTYEAFVEMLNRGNADDSARLAKLPGFVAAGDAATLKSDKRDILAKMEKAGIDWWPVVNEQGKLEIVERARLVSSLILDVTNQLKVSAPVRNE